MYQSIYVPVDNSDYSNAAAELAVALGQTFRAKLVGSHVYAAKLHDVRFKQMEFTLPDEYRAEEELEKQRRIHDALIGRGLQLISDSYLDVITKRAAAAGLEMERKLFDGKNFVALVDDIRASSYDLVVLGALGQGAVRDTKLGSVTERVLRRTQVDTLVVRDLQNVAPQGPGGIVVCVDGSARSYGALTIALELGKTFGKHVQAILVRNPERPEDALLEQHLKVVTGIAGRKSRGFDASLLEGKATRVILDHTAYAMPWLVVVGRTGIDAIDDDDLGSTAERIVRESAHNVLVVSRTVSPVEQGV